MGVLSSLWVLLASPAWRSIARVHDSEVMVLVLVLETSVCWWI